jgi:hypothetical protein
MAFKLYDEKSSVKKKHSRYTQGGVSEVGEAFIRWWERDSYETDDVTDRFYVIPDLYATSPDLISYDYYGRNDLGWLILQYNKIVDINEELVAGVTIRLPNKNRVFFELLSRPVSA